VAIVSCEFFSLVSPRSGGDERGLSTGGFTPSKAGEGGNSGGGNALYDAFSFFGRCWPFMLPFWAGGVRAVAFCDGLPLCVEGSVDVALNGRSIGISEGTVADERLELS